MSQRTLTIVYILLFVVVSVYLVLRAFYVPLVHDEAETFFIYFVNFDFLPYQGWISANNHFINSFFGAVFYRLFGTSEWALRLPNLLALPLYGYYLFKLSGIIDNKIIRLGLLLALITTPFYIEYFALARGYGMAMALLAPYLYYVTQYLENKSQRDFGLGLFFGLMCILASLTCFFIFLIITAVLALNLFMDVKNSARHHTWYKIVILLILHVIPALFFIKYILYLGTINELVVGSLDGFHAVTIAPLIQYLTGSDAMWVEAIFLTAFAIIIYVFTTQFLKLKSIVFFVRPENLFPITLFLSMLFIVFNGYVLEITFPRDRAALFLFPLFIFSFSIVLDKLKIGPLMHGLTYSLLFFFPVSLVLSANLTHSVYWQTKYISPLFYEYILAKEGDQKSTIGSLSLRQTIWYHKIFSNEKKLNPLSIDNAETNITTDFKIQPPNVNPNILENYTLLYEDKIAGNNLYERINKVKRTLSESGPVIPFAGNSMYHDFIKLPVDEEMLNQPYVLDIELLVLTEKLPFEFSLYVKLNDKDGQSISDQSVRMSRLKYNWNENTAYNLLLTLDSLPEQTKEIIAFLYNNYEHDYELQSGSYKLYKLVTD